MLYYFIFTSKKCAILKNMNDDERFIDSVREFASSVGEKSAFVYSKEENAYVYEGNTDTFDCPSCQSLVSYGECDCGVMWYVFRIYENDTIKTIAREIDTSQIPKKVANKVDNPTFELL